MAAATTSGPSSSAPGTWSQARNQASAADKIASRAHRPLPGGRHDGRSA
jgi:hypothetical protein